MVIHGGVRKAVFYLLSVALAIWPLAWLFSPIGAYSAATFYFSPSSVKVNIGQTTTVSLFVSSPDQAMNSAGATIVLPESYVEAVSVSKSGSLLTTWTEDPAISGSTIKFSGGLPTPGYIGGGAKILSFEIRGLKEGTGLITLNQAKILANDGQGTNIISGSATSTVTVSRVIVGASITSTTHPDQNSWYNQKNIELSWNRPSGVTGFSYTFSKEDGSGGESAQTNSTSASFANKADGVWKFTLRTNFDNGQTTTSTFTIRIDTAPPNPFTVKFEQPNGPTDAFPILTMDATDTPSGIDRYEIIIDDFEPLISTEASIKLPRQRPGTHYYTVKAIDRAGNYFEVKGQFEIVGFPGPVITDYPRLVAALQPITLRGRGLLGATIKLFIDGKEVAEFVVANNLTEKQRQNLESEDPEQTVEWVYTYKGIVLPGKHTLWAIQVKSDGSESNRSNGVSMRITASSINLGGLIIPLSALVVILLVLLIIAAAILIWLHRKTKQAIVKLLSMLNRAKGKIDEELDELKEDRSKEAIAEAESRIDKTIDDITREIKK